MILFSFIFLTNTWNSHSSSCTNHHYRSYLDICLPIAVLYCRELPDNQINIKTTNSCVRASEENFCYCSFFRLSKARAKFKCSSFITDTCAHIFISCMPEESVWFNFSFKIIFAIYLLVKFKCLQPWRNSNHFFDNHQIVWLSKCEWNISNQAIRKYNLWRD